MKRLHLVPQAPLLGRGTQGVHFWPVNVWLLDNVGGGEEGDLLGDQVGKMYEGGPRGGGAREQKQLRPVVLHMLTHSGQILACFQSCDECLSLCRRTPVGVWFPHRDTDVEADDADE